MSKNATTTYLVTPGGEELAVLPRRDYEMMKETVEHAVALGDYRSGRVPGLTADGTRALVNAISPLAFWRGYRSMTQSELAKKAGIAQNYLSDIENGKRTGDVGLWMRLARALDLPIEVIVDDED